MLNRSVYLNGEIKEDILYLFFINYYLSKTLLPKIILIYGTSTSGKTSIGKELQNQGWYYLEKDIFYMEQVLRTVKLLFPQEFSICQPVLTKEGFNLGLLGKKPIFNNKYPSHIKQKVETILLSLARQKSQIIQELNKMNLVKLFANKAFTKLQKGCPVVVGADIDPEELEEFKRFLNNYPVLTLLIYCPITILFNRLNKRNVDSKLINSAEHRSTTEVISQTARFYKGFIPRMTMPVLEYIGITQKKLILFYLNQLFNCPQEDKRDFIYNFSLSSQDKTAVKSNFFYDDIISTSLSTPFESAIQIHKKYSSRLYNYSYFKTKLTKESDCGEENNSILKPGIGKSRC